MTRAASAAPWRRRAEMVADSLYQRGTVVLSRRQTRRLIRTEQRLIGAGIGGADAILSIAGVPLTIQDEMQHCKFIGITGSGKTTAIGHLIGEALRRGDRAIIADPDGVYSRRFHDPARGDIIFNPFNPQSPQWDIFSEIRDGYDIEDLARSLIPDSPDSHDNEWREYARTFFTDVTERLWEGGRAGPARPTIQDLHHLLTRASVKEMRALLRSTPSAAFLDEHAEKMFASIRAVTSSAVRAFKYIAQQETPPLSIREWVKRDNHKGGVLFLPYHAGEIEALRSTISAWMRLGIFEAMNRPEADQRLWFVVDELGALGRIGGLTDGLTRLRKFGGRVVLGFQSIDQVEALYGKNDANAIVENCGNTLLLRCGTSDEGGTSAFASKLIGEREMMRKTRSSSHRGLTDFIGTRTLSEQYHTEQAVMAAQIEQLANHTGYLRVSSRPEWMQVAVPPMKDPRLPPAGNSTRSLLKRFTSFCLGRAPPVQAPGKMSGAEPSRPQLSVLIAPSTETRTVAAESASLEEPRVGLEVTIRRPHPLDWARSWAGRLIDSRLAWGVSTMAASEATSARALLAAGRAADALENAASVETLNAIESAEPRSASRLSARTCGGLRASGDGETMDTTTVPEQVLKDYLRAAAPGVYIHARTRAEAFRDEGARLTTQDDDQQLITSLVEIAKARQWKAVAVKGTLAFRREAWFSAATGGIEVSGYAPSRDDRQQLHRMRERQRNELTGTTREAAGAPRSKTGAAQTERPARKAQSRAAAESASSATPAKRTRFSDHEKRQLLSEATALRDDRLRYQQFMTRWHLNEAHLQRWRAQFAEQSPTAPSEAASALSASNGAATLPEAAAPSTPRPDRDTALHAPDEHGVRAKARADYEARRESAKPSVTSAQILGDGHGAAAA